MFVVRLVFRMFCREKCFGFNSHTQKLGRILRRKADSEKQKEKRQADFLVIENKCFVGRRGEFRECVNRENDRENPTVCVRKREKA